MSLKVTSLSASPHEPSKTTALLGAVVAELSEHIEMQHRRVLMSEIGPQLGGSLFRAAVGEQAAQALSDVEDSDLLVVATPTYRATYTGLFKHFFDFIGRDALQATPVFLSAIGANLSHSLSIDHQLRPLFSFFQAVSLPVGIFAEHADFEGYAVKEELRSRIKVAVDAALPVISQGASHVPAPR